MPLATGVSHVQYVTAGVPIHFCAKFLRVVLFERCWTHTYPGVVFLLVSPSVFFCVSVALCAASAGSLTNACSVLLTTLDFQFFSLLSRRM